MPEPSVLGRLSLELGLSTAATVLMFVLLRRTRFLYGRTSNITMEIRIFVAFG